MQYKTDKFDIPYLASFLSVVSNISNKAYHILIDANDKGIAGTIAYRKGRLDVTMQNGNITIATRGNIPLQPQYVDELTEMWFPRKDK